MPDELNTCLDCRWSKPRSEFHGNGKGRIRSVCKDCYNESRYSKDKNYTERLKKREPWRIVLWNIRKRCRTDEGYKHLSCTLTIENVKELWHRDNASTLKRPSIDRINNLLGYYKGNCQFIELGINSVKDKKGKKYVRR